MMELVPLYRDEDSRVFSLPCEDIKRKWPIVNQEEDLYQEPNHAGTLILGFQPQTYKK